MHSWDFADTFVDVVHRWQHTEFNGVVSYVDFIRLGLISANYYRERREQDKLLDAYVSVGLVSKRAFMQEATVLQAYNEAKALFV